MEKYMSEKQRRRSYDAEFKKNAIRLSNEPGRSVPEVAQALGIDSQLLYRWRSTFNKNKELAFPGKGIEALTPDQRRIRELEKQLRDVEIERDILKKAVGIFSKNSK